MAKKPPKPNLSHIAESLRPLAVPIGSLTPDPENARTHPEENLAAIEASLREFGQDQPLVVQREGMVVRKGNGRLEAAKRLGWTHVAAVVVESSRIDAIRRSLADNRTAELAGWDESKLAELLTEAAAVAESTAAGLLGWAGDEFERISNAARSAGKQPPEQFPEFNETITTDHQCPKCGYRYSGGK